LTPRSQVLLIGLVRITRPIVGGDGYPITRTGAKRLMEHDPVMTALCLALIIKILKQL